MSGKKGLGQNGDAVSVETPTSRIGNPEEAIDQETDMPEEVIEVENIDEEEGRVPKTRVAPKGPTKREREEHDATHIPYRDWCDHCVRGR